jgi:Glycine zipper
MSTEHSALTFSLRQSLKALATARQGHQVSHRNLMGRGGFATIRLHSHRPFAVTPGGTMKQAITALAAVLLLSTIVGCAGGSLTTREKGAGIGALGGAAVGGIIGAAVGAPGVGAAVGGALGLGAGALVGDQLQGQETKQADQQRQIDANQAEIERQRREAEKLRRQGAEY